MSHAPIPINAGKDLTTTQIPSFEQREEAEAPSAISSVPGASSSEYYLELLIDVLKDMAPPGQGTFLREFLRHLAAVSLTESESITHWGRILNRRAEMSRKLGRPVSLRTTVLDYLESLHLLENPIVLPYGEVKRLRRYVSIDPLTGLHNGLFLEEYLEREVVRAKRYTQDLALVLMDLRNFSKVNDTYGRAVGDDILCRFAKEGFTDVRASDFAFRIGGDEFAILLPQSDRATAMALGERLRRQLARLATILASSVQVGLDLGFAAFPEDGANASSLFNSAQHEMEASKRNAANGRTDLPSPGPHAHTLSAASSTTSSGDVMSNLQPDSSPPVAEGEPLDTSYQGETISHEPDGSSHKERRYKRIALSGSKGLGILRLESRLHVVRVLDMSRGGVGLLLDEAFEMPKNAQSLLRVPTFSPAEFALQPVYAHAVAGSKKRVGCCFANPESGPALLPN